MSTSKNGPLKSYQGAMLPRLTSDQLDPDTNPGLGKSFYYFF